MTIAASYPLVKVMADRTTGIIILAAGSSSRLGQPKQLVTYQGKTLLTRAIEAAKEVASGDVIVVTGAHVHLIKAEVAEIDVHIVHSPLWQQGMASSINAGISALPSGMQQAIIMLCDQPFADAVLLKELIDQQRLNDSKLVACTYGGSAGVPALFDQSLFAELLELKGQEGAKKIIQKYREQATTIPFEKGNIDIDTPTDLEHLR